MSDGYGNASGASAIARNAGPSRSVTAIDVGPMPKRPEIRLEVSAAASDPMLATESRIPIAPGDRPSSRTKKTRMIEKPSVKKRFPVAVHPA